MDWYLILLPLMMGDLTLEFLGKLVMQNHIAWKK
jgi:hypothetical protein